MRRISKLLAVAAVLMAASGMMALAQSGTAHIPDVDPGETYLRSDIWKNVVADTIRLPEVQGQTGGIVFTPPKPGMEIASLKSSGDGFSRGGSIPGSTFGAAFLTPSEKTTNEIRKVMRRLG